jgi:hypothetical protein
MDRILLSQIKNLVEYERARDSMRARAIAVKQRRRVVLGDQLSLLFENAETVIYQIQEMVRTERIVDEKRIQDEIDAYAPLIPDAGELSATLFIEIPELARLPQEEVRQAVNRFQGIDRALFLHVGPHAVPAQFEAGFSKEEKMAAVQYVRFKVPPEARKAMADPSNVVRLVADHPHYKAEAVVSPDTRAELLADLS